MKTATLVFLVVLAVLLEIPGGSAGPCRCASKSKKQLPARNNGENEISFFQRIFAVDTSSECSVKKFYKNVFYQYDGESKQDYLNRIDIILGQVYRNLDCRFDTQRKDLLETYYKYKYAKTDEEDDEEYFERALTKTTESEREYKNKIKLIKKFIGNIDWGKVKIEEKTQRGFSLIRSLLARKSCGCQAKRKRQLNKKGRSCGCKKRKTRVNDNDEVELTEEEIRKSFIRTDREDTSSYFSRIITSLSSRGADYVNSVTKVRKCLPSLSLWYDTKYIDLVRTYYTSLFAKLSTESEEEYFSRIIKRESFETDEQCARRIEIVRELYPSLSLWTNENFYEKYTRGFYLTVFKKSTTEDDISYYNRILLQTDKETDLDYINRISLIKRSFSSLPLWYSTNYLDLTRKYYITKYTKASSESEEDQFKRILTKETDETDDVYCQRVEVVRLLLPNLSLWSADKYYKTYTRKIYQTLYKKTTTEDELSYYKRILTQAEKETETDYIKRLSLIKKTYCSLPLWYSKNYVDLVSKYYLAKYTRASSESEEDQFKRIVAREDDETDDIYAQRIEVVRSLFSNLSLWSSSKYYSSCTKKIYQMLYKKSTSEDELSYYRRILTQADKESETDYINRISLIKRTYSTLPLWYNRNYLSVLNKYYTSKYSTLSSETEEARFKRILTKEDDETDDQFYQRVGVVSQCYPNLPLWYSEKYYESLTKNFFQSFYKKSSTEDETSYFTRLCAKSDSESDETYIGRMNLLEKTFSNLPLWYNVQNLDIVKQYYLLKYAQQSGETNEAFLSRVLARDVCDSSDEILAQRIYLVQQLTVSNAVWYDEQFYDKYTKSFYTTYYKLARNEGCDGLLTRVIRQLPGESEEYAFKRIALIKRATSDCGCWNLDSLSKLEASKAFSAEYIAKIRSAFFVTSYSKKSSSSASSSKSASAEENEDVVVIKRGSC